MLLLGAKKRVGPHACDASRARLARGSATQRAVVIAFISAVRSGRGAVARRSGVGSAGGARIPEHDAQADCRRPRELLSSAD